MRSAVLATVLFFGCADTSRWSSQPGESFCGNVTSASFVRAGIPEGTKLRLELDAEHLQTAPGRIWTGAFSSGERFDGMPLRPIPQLFHDPLSTLTFGEGRVKNAILVGDLRSADGASTTEVMVVVSLLQSGEVEVRVLRGASAGSAPAGQTAPPQLFGVFGLRREKGDCDVK